MSTISLGCPTFSCSDSRSQGLAFGQKSVQEALTLSVKTGSHLRLVTVGGIDAIAVLEDLFQHLEAETCTRQFEYADGLIQESTETVPSETSFIACSLASYEALFGKLHYHQEQWLFQPGLLFTCKNHFVALRAEQLLANPELTAALAASVRSGELQWPQQVLQKSVAIRLAPTPLLCRFVLLGTPLELLALETEWPDLVDQLPIYGEFYDRVTITQAESFPGYLGNIAKQACGYELTTAGCSYLMQIASRWAEHNEYFTLAHSSLSQLIKEASTLVDTAEPIDEPHIRDALLKREQRQSLLAQESYRDFAEGTMKLQVEGAVVGQVNGLTVVDVGQVSYGEPARITASVHYGDGDVIDIERKAELAGNIHAKGTMILTAYVAQIFAKDAPLHLSANIVFEQSYYEVDGDSASLAELVALLSALGRIPVHQHMAVTGAIDQFGNVQAIGGVNEKVEGFFEVASLIKPEQKVAIVMPASNALQLNLNDKCRQAVASGQLEIHTIDHVSEALELLMSTPSGIGKEDEHQRYPAESVFGKVQRRLLALADPEDSEPGLISRFFDLFRA